MRRDAGRKRAHYDMSGRLLAKQIRDAERTLALASRPPVERRGRPRRERREASRAAALPADRVCPSCGRVKLRSRQWVVTEEGTALCLSCHRKEA